jgi:DNA repair exonuclease SbcCD ATPase subunit
MKFHQLKIENFLAITNAKIDLSDRGLVLIEGINNADTSAKSNGAGKSSIADALCWVWFGTTARGESGDDVVNAIAGKNCLVSSTVVDGGMTYTATRHRKHKTGKNNLTIVATDGFKTIDLTKGTDKLTQEVANQIIGASLDVFAGSIYAGQEKMPDLPAMTDKMLKVLIEEAAGVTALETAYKKAREEALAEQSALQEAEHHLTNAKVGLVSAQNLIDNLKTAETVWSDNRKTMISTIKHKTTTFDAPRYKTMAEEVRMFEALRLEDQIAAIDAKIAAVDAENIEFGKLEREVATLDTKISMAALGSSQIENELKRAKTALKNTMHKVGCPCDSCGRPLGTTELGIVIAQAEKAIVDITARQVAHDKELEDLATAHRKAVEARDAFRATMTDLSAENASRAALTRSVTEKNAKKAEALSLLAQIKADIARVKALDEETSPHASQIEAAEKRETDIKKQIVDLTARRDAVMRRFEVITEVVKVFSPAGVRAHILDDVTPYLNDQTAKYLSILSDGNIEATWTTLTKNAKGEFKEKFSIDVSNATGGKKFGLISGGEKRKVRIATALALQDLVSTRATKPIDIFIGDEIDDALDSAGLERLMIILEEKARERGSVFIISHNDLKDMCRNVLTVEKTATGETKITETSV